MGRRFRYQAKRLRIAGTDKGVALQPPRTASQWHQARKLANPLQAVVQCWATSSCNQGDWAGAATGATGGCNGINGGGCSVDMAKEKGRRVY